MTTTDELIEESPTPIAIYADALSPGDRIVGDGRYSSGMLDFLVQDVTVTGPSNGRLVTVQILVERTVTYAGDDTVIVEIGSVTSADPFAGIVDVKSNDGWDA